VSIGIERENTDERDRARRSRESSSAFSAGRPRERVGKGSDLSTPGPELPDDFAVVGGGIAGLVAARELTRAAGTRVVLFEASERLGGKIRTGALEGLQVEEGPDSFVAREPAARRLCEELGLGADLVEPAAFGAHVWLGDKLRPIPAGFVLGVPADPLGVVSSRILSVRGALRALGDLVLPGRLEGPDVAVGDLVRRRFGPEVLDRLVDPILAGTRAGSTDQMSLAAAAPQIDAVARAHRSITLGLVRDRQAGGSQGAPPFLGLRSGMERLVDRLREELAERTDIRTATSVEGIAASNGSYRLQHAGGETAVAGVVVAAPAFAAAKALAGLSPEAAAELDAIDYASVGIVNLLYPPGAVRPPPQGSGILVPSSQRRMLAGCTWTDRKWPHLAPPDGGTLIRCFVGRGGGEPALDLPDDELARRADAELAAAMKRSVAPRAWQVTRWRRAIPQYVVGHNERMDLVESALARWPGLALAGSAYRGSGLTDCVIQGQSAARRVLAARPA
jgi:oxygen-dependent protoporphyrinogen oxidase